MELWNSTNGWAARDDRGRIDANDVMHADYCLRPFSAAWISRVNNAKTLVDANLTNAVLIYIPLLGCYSFAGGGGKILTVQLGHTEWPESKTNK